MKLSPWRKSSRSGNANDACVELRTQGSTIGVRDSKNPQDGHITISKATLAALTARVKRGELDL